MTDEQYAEDSQKMIVHIKLYEHMIECFNLKKTFNREEWLNSLDSINFGREILDRGFLKMFFGGGPKGINNRIRKALIQKMIEIDKNYPVLKGENFDIILKEEVSKLK